MVREARTRSSKVLLPLLWLPMTTNMGAGAFVPAARVPDTASKSASLSTMSFATPHGPAAGMGVNSAVRNSLIKWLMSLFNSATDTCATGRTASRADYAVSGRDILFWGGGHWGPMAVQPVIACARQASPSRGCFFRRYGHLEQIIHSLASVQLVRNFVLGEGSPGQTQATKP